MSDSLRLYGLYPTRLLCPWTFPGKNTRVTCHFLLQGFPLFVLLLFYFLPSQGVSILDYF